MGWSIRSQRAFAEQQRQRGARLCEHGCGHRNDWHQIDVVPPVLELRDGQIIELKPADYSTIRCYADRLGKPACPCSYPNSVDHDPPNG